MYSLNRSIFNVTPDASCHTTSLPEEAFYLFDLIVSRAISQGSAGNIKTVIGIIKGSIQQYIHPYMISILRGRKTMDTSGMQFKLSSG